MNQVLRGTHSDLLWQYPKGKEICRQYVQGHCNYGVKCKYDHPSAGERSSDPLSLSTHSNQNGGIWTSFGGFSTTQHQGLQEQSQYQYSTATRLLSNGTLVPSSNPENTSQPPVDSKKTSSIIAWKTTPCKHFIKNNGWCPLGDACNFIHDWHLVYSTMWNSDNIRQTSEPSFRSDGNQKAASHCWAFVQGRCRPRNCRYFHPADIQPYVKYTPCPAWALCNRRSTCPFKHPEAHPLSPQEVESVTATPAAPPPPPPPAQTFYPPPPPSQPFVYPPVITKPDPIQVNGTTYFPIVRESTVHDEYHYPVSAPMPIAAPIPIPLPTSHIPPLSVFLPPTTPPPSYHLVPQSHQPFAGPQVLEHSYVRESPPPESLPAPAPMEDLVGEALIQTDPPPVVEPVPAPPAPVSEPISAAVSISAELEKETRRSKKRLNGHVRRISINTKTGEVIERTQEGRHGVYGL